jgi:hypothetical protein
LQFRNKRQLTSNRGHHFLLHFIARKSDLSRQTGTRAASICRMRSYVRWLTFEIFSWRALSVANGNCVQAYALRPTYSPHRLYRSNKPAVCIADAKNHFQYSVRQLRQPIQVSLNDIRDVEFWPRLPTWALQQVGSYLGYAGRDASVLGQAKSLRPAAIAIGNQKSAPL